MRAKNAFTRASASGSSGRSGNGFSLCVRRLAVVTIAGTAGAVLSFLRGGQW
jgi:hypothetical protein